MGYTHYFRQVGPAPTNQEWEKIETRVKEEVFPKHKNIIFSDDCKPPIANAHCVCFNGKEDDGHETFFLEQGQEGFEFCKTARKPYDAAVVATLKIAKEVCPRWLELSSDGDGEEKSTKENPDGLIFP